MTSSRETLLPGLILPLPPRRGAPENGGPTRRATLLAGAAGPVVLSALRAVPPGTLDRHTRNKEGASRRC